MQTTIMLSLFIIQLVTSVFGSHYLLHTPDIPTVGLTAAIDLTFSWSGLWTWITSGTWATVTNLVNSNMATKVLSQAIAFSWNMMWFAVPDCPPIFNYIWLVMTFVIVWILIDKIRGHNT